MTLMRVLRRRHRGRLKLALTTLVVAVVSIALGTLLRTDTNIDAGAQSPFLTLPPAKEAAVVTVNVSRGGRGALAWSGWGFDPSHHRTNPEARQRPPFTSRWRRGFRGLLEFPPVVDDSGLFLQVSMSSSRRHPARSQLVSLNPESGRRRWTANLPPPVASSPALDATSVYAISLRGQISAFRRQNGRRRWTFDIGARSESSPLLLDGTLYFGAEDGSLIALNAMTGHVRWRRRVGGAIKGSPAFADGILVVGSYDGHVSAWSTVTGTRLWRSGSIGRSFSAGQFYSTPTIAYGRVYIGSIDHRVYSYILRTGAIAWTKSTGGWVYASPAVTNQLVLIGSYDGRFRAYDARTGAQRWSFDAGGKISGSATVVNDIVYFSAFGRGTFGLDLRSGKLRYHRKQGRYSPVVATRDAFYFVGYNTLERLRQLHRRS